MGPGRALHVSGSLLLQACSANSMLTSPLSTFLLSNLLICFLSTLFAAYLPTAAAMLLA